MHSLCVCVCLGLARMMLEGKRFFRPSLVVAIVVVGLPGQQSCLPACQPSCQTCLFQAFNYVCLGPGPDTHTYSGTPITRHTQKHGKSFVMPAEKGMQGVGVLVWQDDCRNDNCIEGIPGHRCCLSLVIVAFHEKIRGVTAK